MSRRLVYACALLPVLVIGIGLTSTLIGAQARWDAAQATQADLRDARQAATEAKAAQTQAETDRQQARALLPKEP